jgi:hypothetical protein
MFAPAAGSRDPGFLVWDAALSAANLLALHDATKGRFEIS